MIKATRDCVIVRRLAVDPEAKVNGLYIPAKALAPPLQGTAISVGPQVRDVRAGDRVLFPTHAGSPLTHERETLLVFREYDLIAVLDQ